MKYGPGGTLPSVKVNGVTAPLAVNVHAAIDVSMAGVEAEI